jgi:preprotein translocase subunit YajC
MLTSGIYGKITAVLDNQVEMETSPGNTMLVAMGAVRSIEQEPKSAKPAARTATKQKPSAKPAAKTPVKKK